ncbi:DNA polymerase III subunit delta [Candidatus Berkiella aquae]|nr:DNA polymerase III subunit delta [Candidatus Berkiella aquae]MCS5710588.1 DNA polymerase III subunit delta [Candidatus Berkiella aquae]
MRVAPEQLEEHLKRQQRPIYLLSGSESFLLEESADKIRRTLLKDQDVEHKRFNDTTAGIWVELQSEAQHFSLFSSKQLIELKLSKFAASDMKQLVALLESDRSDITFILIAAQLSKQNQQAAWFKLVEQKGVIVTHWPLTGYAFTKWVSTRAKQRGLTLNEQELRLLTYKTEGNCLAASQEIEQLYWFYQDAPQNIPIASLTNQSQFTVFDLCEAALQQQSARIVKIVSCLKESESAAEQLIVWSLSQTLHALLRACHAQESSQRQILTQAGIRNSNSQVLYLKLLKQPTPTRWAKLLSVLSTADRQFKSGENAGFWQNILKISLNLTKSYTHNPTFCI